MKTSLTAGLFFAAAMYGADNAQVLAKHCMASTPREGVRYSKVPTPYDSGMKSFRAAYTLKDGSVLGLSVLAPMKNGQVHYSSGYASMIVSTTEKGMMTMFTDVGIDGLLDKVSLATRSTRISAADTTEEKMQKHYDRIVAQWLEKYR